MTLSLSGAGVALVSDDFFGVLVAISRRKSMFEIAVLYGMIGFAAVGTKHMAFGVWFSFVARIVIS